MATLAGMVLSRFIAMISGGDLVGSTLRHRPSAVGRICIALEVQFAVSVMSFEINRPKLFVAVIHSVS